MSKTTDVAVLGGGVIGLSIALELRLKGASVTVLTRSLAEAAGHAAAGMLAPQAEQIPPGPMLDLCLRSRALYGTWVEKLESIAGLDAGYWPCGILSPVYEEQVAVGSAQPQALAPSAEWLDRQTVHQHQAGLSPAVAGGWWYPADGQVDNRALMRTLITALQDLGVSVQEGIEVQHCLHEADRVTAVATSAGQWQAEHYILATGSWSQALLAVPVTPQKGQMLAVRVPQNRDLWLRQVLFGDCYIVPRKQGRIVIGATSEAVGFAPYNTPVGVRSLLDRALQLLPALAELPIEELWWGFRPLTPDQQPILGNSPYANLTLATGHHRNGILLAPITAELIANWVWHQQADPLLQSFHWSRFAPG